MSAISSAGGVLALLDDTDPVVQAFALRKLDGLVDQFWAEISDVVEKIEILHETEGFAERALAALVVSKVYFHLGALDDSVTFALHAGDVFDVNGTSQYVTTIVGQCIDKYTALRHTGDAEGSAALKHVVDRMFTRCFNAGEFAQAAGIALETRRLDVLYRSISTAPDVAGMLAYVYDIAQTLLSNRTFRARVLEIVVQVHASLPTPGYAAMSQIFVFLDDAPSAAAVLRDVLGAGKAPLALQLAFDLFDSATQHFLARVRAELAASPNGVLDAATLKLFDDILAGDVTHRLAVEFLSRSNNTDLLILQTTRKIIGTANSVLHSALVLSNSCMYAGTTSEAFLRDDPSWVMKAQNWAKFGVVSSLGVIHKGHAAEAMNIVAPYLPKEGSASGNPYEIGGGFFALGLMLAGHGGGVTDYLAEKLGAPAASEIVQHGNCLGLGLAALGSGSVPVFDLLKGVLFADSAVAGEAAGIAMGLVMLGAANQAAVAAMLQYAQETQHEKIIRGLALGIALVMYNAQEAAESLIVQLIVDKDALLRMSAVFTIAMAFVGTGDNGAIERLLHLAVSDVSDDVRRVAVAALGFVLCHAPEQVPGVVSLLSESYNPHVRHGACLALAVACANTGSAEALALIEPMFEDTSNFVRQGALIAAAMVMMQQPNSHPKSASIRAHFVKVIAAPQDVLVKFGAIYAQGLIESGGRNVTVSLVREGGHVSMNAAVGLLVWTQMWFWFPLAHFLALATSPTALVALNKDLQMPKMQLVSHAPPSAFAYPPKTEPPKAEVKNKIATAVLSITAKAKAQQQKKKEDDGGAMQIDGPPKAVVPDDDMPPLVAPEPAFLLLDNPARVVRAQLSKIAFEGTGRYHPVRAGPLRMGVVIVNDATPGVAQEFLPYGSALAGALGTAGAADATDAANGPEPDPPVPFDFDDTIDA